MAAPIQQTTDKSIYDKQDLIAMMVVPFNFLNSVIKKKLANKRKNVFIYR